MRTIAHCAQNNRQNGPEPLPDNCTVIVKPARIYQRINDQLTAWLLKCSEVGRQHCDCVTEGGLDADAVTQASGTASDRQ